MEDKLGPAARLVDFLLGCTLDSRLKMHFPKYKSTSVHIKQGAFERDLQVTVSDRYSDRKEMESPLEYAKEIE